jgi:hypothetical protein
MTGAERSALVVSSSAACAAHAQTRLRLALLYPVQREYGATSCAWRLHASARAMARSCRRLLRRLCWHTVCLALPGALSLSGFQRTVGVTVGLCLRCPVGATHVMGHQHAPVKYSSTCQIACIVYACLVG